MSPSHDPACDPAMTTDARRPEPARGSEPGNGSDAARRPEPARGSDAVVDGDDRRRVPPGDTRSTTTAGARRHGPTRAVYVISVAAELAGVHPQTLRIYERRGLVDPSRTGGGSRRYSESDIDRLRHIGDLTEAGLNLEGVRRVLELEAQLEEVTQELHDARRQLEMARVETREALEQLHRHYRRDLVPVRQATMLWRPPRPPRPRS